MLKQYPERLLDFAYAGVIAPSAVGEAAKAEQLEQIARRRAAKAVAEAEGQADALREQARREGYAQGYADGVAVAAAPLHALLGDAQRLRDQLSARMREVLESSLEAEGVAAALVVQRCESALAESSEVALCIPERDTELARAVKARLGDDPRIIVRSGQAPSPLLQVGPLTVELNLSAPLLTAIDATVDEAALAVAAQHRAALYVDNLATFLRRRAGAETPPPSLEPTHEH